MSSDRSADSGGSVRESSGAGVADGAGSATGTVPTDESGRRRRLRGVAASTRGCLARNGRLVVAAGVALLAGGLAGATVLAGTGTVGNPPARSPTFFIAHNAGVLGVLWLGVVTGGLSTLASLLTNGLAFGRALAATGAPLATRVALFVPHAVFEVPGFLLAGAAGFLPIDRLIRYLRGRTESVFEARDVRDLAHLVALSAACIVVGGVIEGTITRMLARSLGG